MSSTQMKTRNQERGGADRFAALTAAALLGLAGQAWAQTSSKPASAPALGAQPMVSKPDNTSGTVGGLRNPLDKTATAGQQGSGGDVQVDENLIVDLHVNDEDLANVLQMLSIQSQRNIVASKSVSATVTANLYGVTFYQALDAILHVNGYGYIERDNFIYVYTLAEIQEIEKTLRKKVNKIINLNYLNSSDAAEFAKSLLSEAGSIKVNGKVDEFNLGSNPVGGEDFAHSSTMVIFDYEENVAEIENLVMQLDTKPQQVLVEATILQSSLSEANAFGVDFAAIADLNFTDFTKLGGPLKAIDGLISGGDQASSSSGSGGSGGTGTTVAGVPSDNKGGGFTSTPGNTAGPGTLKLGIVANDVAAFVRFLDEVSDTTVLSRPTVMTLNRQPAGVLVGRNVGYINTVSTDTSSNTSLATISTGTQLFLRPFVSKDGTIRMELKPKVSEPVFRSVTGPNGTPISIPDEITNELTANVMVKDGQTIVLGGLFREGVQATRRQVPGLGDVPVIGAAFRGHDDATSRSEIIFLITPTLVNDDTIMAQGERAMGLVENTRTGLRTGLLPWSRDKRTSQFLIEAERLAAAGDLEGALNRVNRAISMNPFQPEAIALRERLSNEKEFWPTRSLMNEIVKQEHVKRAKLAEGYVQRNPERYMKNMNKTAEAPAPKAQPTAKVETSSNTQNDWDASNEAEFVPAQAVTDEAETTWPQPENQAQASTEPMSDEAFDTESNANQQTFATEPTGNAFENMSGDEPSNDFNTNFNAGAEPAFDAQSFEPIVQAPLSTFESSGWDDAMAISAITANANGFFTAPISLVTRQYWTLFRTDTANWPTNTTLTNVDSDANQR
jgi:type IV pilus assembly protein PilQ